MAEFERTGQFGVRTLTERKFRRATSDVDHKMSLVGRWYGAECAEMDEAGLLSAGDNAYGDSCLVPSCFDEVALILRFAYSACGDRNDGGAMGVGEASKTAEGFDSPRNGLRSELFHIAAAGTEAHRELLARHDLGCTTRNRAGDHEM